MSSLILASTWLVVFGGVSVASIAVANVAERTPRSTELFFRFIAAMIESRQLQAQRVIDRYRANDGHCAGSGLPQPDQTGASSQNRSAEHQTRWSPQTGIASNRSAPPDRTSLRRSPLPRKSTVLSRLTMEIALCKSVKSAEIRRGGDFKWHELALNRMSDTAAGRASIILHDRPEKSGTSMRVRRVTSMNGRAPT